MPEQSKVVNCIKCDSELNGQFCSNCGHPRELVRINGKYVLSEIGSVLNFDKGILYTIKELIIRPGLSVREFINQDRNRLVRPIIFLILCSLIYTLAQKFFQFEDGYINYSDLEETSTSLIFNWVSQNYGYSNILMSIFIGFWLKIFFRKYDYNFFEILILLCFVMGIGMLIYSVFGIIGGLINLKILQIGGIIGFLYTSIAIGEFFDGSKKFNYLKAFISYFLGMLSFLFGAIALGSIIDFILKTI